ncbi:MAG: glycosyltransferase family 2 protein [bacterium]|nr:glycosyltransferase family 2 protein [bacterium]
MDLSVIIVSFNTKDLLRKCLVSVFASKTSYQFEVLVSDNGSHDESPEMVKADFPQARLLENGANLGFSKGNNVALRLAQGRYLLLLNSDTEIAPDALESSVRYMDKRSDVGILGGKVVLFDGRLDQACRRRFPNPWNSFLRLFGLKRFSDYNIDAPVDAVMEVDAVMGAYMLIRKSVADKIGLLDEEFFMYGEDLDWCWRAKEEGFKTVYYPPVKVTHYKYGSSRKIPLVTIKAAHEAMRIFYRKHYAPQYNSVLNWLVYAGIFLRMYVVVFLNLFRQKKSVH